MRLAIMQPYFFPYLGYFQLARSVDCFVFLDDVAFIKAGFVNRNRILAGGSPFRFSIPVVGASQNRKIREHVFAGNFQKFLAQLRQEYARAPFFLEVFALIESVAGAPEQNVAIKNAHSIKAVFDYLDLPLSWDFSSRSSRPQSRGQERILDLCGEHGATSYHNASGGQQLYAQTAFAERNIELRFLRNHFPAYPQNTATAFVAGLSIIDVLMHVSREDVRAMFDAYDLLAPLSASGPEQ